MESIVDTATIIGIGYATHPDAFQCGREAAQVAKNQIPDGHANLVLVLGQADYHFKDFIEGVRLVLGEETLIGIPTSYIVSNEIAHENTRYVIAVKSQSTRFVLAGDNTRDGTTLERTTLVVSQFREKRGNLVRDVKDHGVIFFNHNIPNADQFGVALGADVGLGTWLMGVASSAPENTLLVCQGNNWQEGIVGIECLSQQPWGLGSVNVGAFPNQKEMMSKAVAAALREALAQLPSKTASLGFIFFDRAPGGDIDLTPDMLKEAAAVVPRTPLFGLLTQHHFVRRPQRAITTQHNAVLALLLPA